MKKMITVMSISLGIVFVVALANAEDTTTNAKESTYESSQTTNKHLPGTGSPTDTTTTGSTGTTTDSKSCTDTNGVVHPSSDKQAYNDCISAMNKQKKSRDMGGQAGPGATPSYAPES